MVKIGSTASSNCNTANFRVDFAGKVPKCSRVLQNMPNLCECECEVAAFQCNSVSSCKLLLFPSIRKLDKVFLEIWQFLTRKAEKYPQKCVSMMFFLVLNYVMLFESLGAQTTVAF